MNAVLQRAAGGASVDDEPIESEMGRGTGWRERIDEAIPPVAAKKPPGSSDCSKLVDTRRRRSPMEEELMEDDAGRFSTARLESWTVDGRESCSV